MKETEETGTVTISIKEHDRLRKADEANRNNITQVYHRTSFTSGSYESESITVLNIDETMTRLGNMLMIAELELYKKKWYQFVERKNKDTK